jgi:hypothetical protein
VRQTLAYAEKWERRGALPAALFPAIEAVTLGPCLPRPAALRRLDGQVLDRLAVRGPGAILIDPPRPGLAAVGLAGGRIAGFCLALEDAGGAVLGAWLSDQWPTGSLELRAGGVRRSQPLKAWEGLALPALGAGLVLLLPPARLKALPTLPAGAELRLSVPFEQLRLSLGSEGLHPTVQ